MCYSFFDNKNGHNETMEDHINEGLKIIDILDKRGYSQYLSRTLEINNNKLANQIMKVSFVFHDIGKGLEFFQKRKKGFPAHEFYSAKIFLDAVKINGISEHIKKIIAIAIQLHHHTMKNRTSILNNNNTQIKLNKDCEKLFIMYSKQYNVRFAPQNMQVSNRSTYNNMRKLHEYLSNHAHPSSINDQNYDVRILRKVYALLYPIIIADNYSAYINRTTPQQRTSEKMGIIMRDISQYVDIMTNIL